MSLRYKILAAVIGITVVVLGLVLWVILMELVAVGDEFREYDAALRRKTAEWIDRNARDLAGHTGHASAVAEMPLVREVVHVAFDEPAGAIVFLKPGGEIEEAHVVEMVRRALAAGDGRGETLVEGSEIAVPDEPRSGAPRGGTWVRLDVPAFSPHEPLRKIYIVMLVGLVAIVVVIYVILSRGVIRPVERLERAATRVAAGDYSRPVEPTGRNDELDTLVHAFNTMMFELGQIRAYLEERAAEERQKARAAERNLVIAQRLAATGKLASGIAHEVNNPLAGMQNAARRLLRDPPPEDEKRREYLELIIEGLDRVKETVKKILQFTPHQVAPQAVPVETVISRALALATHRLEKDETEVEVDLPPGAQVYGDPFELQQVFLNILINSMDAIAAAGRRGLIRVEGNADGNEIRIRFHDNGCGMSEEQLSQAFDLFYTTKPVGEGTGLGLSIAHNVIQNHGGRLELRSTLGEGSVVEIALPLLNGPRG